MSVTNKKIDTLRRLFLGPLYGDCKNNPMGVSKEKLQKRLNKLINEGCKLECNVDEMINICRLKSHYPLCADDRECIEKKWDKQREVEILSYEKYIRSKAIENDPDDDDIIDEDEPLTNKKKIKKAGILFINRTDNIIRVLLARNRSSGIWGFPKGKCKKNEELEECAKREAFEETGILVDNLKGKNKIKLGNTDCFIVDINNINEYDLTNIKDTFEIDLVEWKTSQELELLNTNNDVKDFIKKFKTSPTFKNY